MSTIIITRLADLRVGDAILSLDGTRSPRPRVVVAELGPLEPGSPVRGVRLQSPNPGSGVEYVLYPSQVAGSRLEVERH